MKLSIKARACCQGAAVGESSTFHDKLDGSSNYDSFTGPLLKKGTSLYAPSAFTTMLS